MAKPDIGSLKSRLHSAVQAEKRAMTRLRRAQTLYEKYFNRRVRLQDQMFEIDAQVQRVINRLEHSK